jgi:membrane protease YdiL (CAAX protease family)
MSMPSVLFIFIDLEFFEGKRGMSQTDGSSATIKSSENTGFQIATATSGWRESILVLVMVLAPIGLAAIVMVIGVSSIAAWQIFHGVPVELPTPANIRLYGMLSYAVVSWIDVAVVWLWSSRRGLSRDVFIFRRLTWPALTASIVGFVIAMYGVPIVTHWLSYVTGSRSHDVRIDFHDTQSVAIFVFLFVVTTPVTEEILYRGLLVTWLRRVGWRGSAILLVGSLIFGANHFIPLGSLVWSAAMVGLGIVLFALRLRYGSLSPAWLAHFLFNAQPILSYPLIAWLAPALLPGRL